MRRNCIRFLLALCLCVLLCACEETPQTVQQTPTVTKNETGDAVQAVEKVFFTNDTALWQYLDAEQAQWIAAEGHAWALPTYDSSAWRSGYGPFGAKNGEKAILSEKYGMHTLLQQYQEESGDNKPSFFFRIAFQLEDPQRVEQLRARISYDDAVILYLNGHQVYAGNVPQEGYENNFAYGAEVTLGAPITESVLLAPEHLRRGENLLAVELHQSDRNSSDVYFQLLQLEALLGEIRLVSIAPGQNSDSVNVCWIQSGRKNDRAAILISKLGSAQPPVRYEATQVEPNRAPGYTYRAEIHGLDEQSRYSYTVIGGSGKTGTFHTGTGKDGTDVLLLGDPQLQLCDNLANVLSDVRKGIDFAVCFGDVSSEAEDYPVYESAINSLAASLKPMAMLIGNHDVRTDNLSDCVALPNMTQYGASRQTGSMSGDYWFDWNGNLFLCLNTNELDSSVHEQFLQEAIAQYRAAYGQPQWQLVMMHQAIFSQGNNYQSEEIEQLRESLAPLFSALDIDVVCSGHDHTYSRSYLMHNTDAVPYEGKQVTRAQGQVLYLTLNSCTGAKFYDLSPKQDYTAYCRQSYRAMLTQINITPNRMHIYTWEAEAGRTVDDFYLMKRQDEQQ